MTADELRDLLPEPPDERPVVAAEDSAGGALIGEVVGVHRYDDAIVIRVKPLGT